MAPLAGIRRARGRPESETATAIQTKTPASGVAPVAEPREERLEDRDGHDRQGSSEPDRVGDPVEHARRARPRRARTRGAPTRRGPLAGERGAELGDEQRVGQHEEHAEQCQPDDRLAADLAEHPERVEDDHAGEQRCARASGRAEAAHAPRRRCRCASPSARATKRSRRGVSISRETPASASGTPSSSAA